jgi:hypothetical protein
VVLACAPAGAESTASQEVATTVPADVAATATVAAVETTDTTSVRQVIRLPEGMEQRWARMEAAGRAAGLTDEELARLLDLESRVFMARASGDEAAVRRAVSERRALLTPAQWRSLRDALRRQAVPETVAGATVAETTAPATVEAESVTTAP